MVNEGLQEVMHTAARGENVTCFMLNNGVFGETGGHMTATTVLGQRTKNTLEGRDADEHGYPIRISNLIAELDGAAYVARGAVNNAGNVARTKRMIRRALETQVAGRGLLVRRDPHHVPDRLVHRDAGGARLPHATPRAGARARRAQGRAAGAAERDCRRTVVVAYPWNADDASLEPLRERFPSSGDRRPAVPRAFRPSPPGPRATSSTDAERAMWGRRRGDARARLPTDIGELAPGLRWVQAIGAGIDHLSKRGPPARRCTVTNAAGVAAAPIAEFAIGRLLAVWKRFDEIDEQQRAHELEACVRHASSRG